MKRAILFALIAVGAIAQPQGGPPMAQGDGIWRRNAYYGEIQTFDACVGHQPGSGDYHYHANPTCLRYQLGDNMVLARTTRVGPVLREAQAPWKHSPILGWAFDGYPIYGPYGYADPANPASPVKRLRSSFQLRKITARTSLPDWSLSAHPGVSATLAANQYGPAISTTFPLGRYNEDFEYTAGLGDLDQYNGRQEVTPEFPNGTYAYHVTIDDNGTPAFPYIFGGQLYGTATGGRAQTVGTGAQELVGTPSGSQPSLTSWMRQNSNQSARVISGYDPSAGASTTWPTNTVPGARTSGGTAVAILADVQRVRYSDSTVFVNANGVSSMTMGPWFDATMTGGVFSNFPSNQNYQFQFPRTPAPAATKSTVGMGPQGMWVNGVTVFNTLDGGSYSLAQSNDIGGGNVFPTAIQVSAASYENGPLAPGSLVAAFSLFGATLSSTTATATTAQWPTTLGGTTVTVRDSGGTSRSAGIYYVSPNQVNYRLPADTAAGFASVTINNGTTSYTTNLNVLAVYPHLFVSDANAGASGYLTRVRNGQVTYEPLGSVIDLGPATDQVYLVLFGSGLGTAASATATINDSRAQVLYAGAQGAYAGLDQYNLLLDRSLVGAGIVPVVLTASGRPSNAVFVNIR